MLLWFVPFSIHSIYTSFLNHFCYNFHAVLQISIGDNNQRMKKALSTMGASVLRLVYTSNICMLLVKTK
jgi:hypothetical protein